MRYLECGYQLSGDCLMKAQCTEKCSSQEEADLMFANIAQELNKENEKKEILDAKSRELECTALEMMSTLQKVHTNPDEISEKDFDNVQKLICKASDIIAAIKNVVDNSNYYKYHDCFRKAIQKLCLATSFAHYLRYKKVFDRKSLAEQFNLKTCQDEGFHLDIEDYLFSQLDLVTELTRLATNAVAAGNIPIALGVTAVIINFIAQFVRKADARFHLLNLKNDALRRRFDVLKYDLQKVEQIIYDLTIRGMRSDIGT